MISIEQFSQVRVLCIGDAMLDRFIGGAVRRISPESPVPVLSVSGSRTFAGGAANVARNIAALGGHCTLIGVVGKDDTGAHLENLLIESQGIDPCLIAVGGRPTTEKIRFVAHGQHLLRTDSEDSSAVPADVEALLLGEIEKQMGGHHVVVLSDYAKGVLTETVVAGTIALARKVGIPVIVDPKSANFARYDGATVVTPNSHEISVATGIDPIDDAHAADAGRKVLDKTTIELILVTRAEKGMTLISRDRPPLHIPSCARDVADVVGAGDTVIATLALAFGAGGDPGHSATIANTAAGIAVSKRGTATITSTELIEELEIQSRKGLASPSVKVLSPDGASERVSAWRNDGLKIGFTNGCFDILHAGHIAILDFARSHCDRLVVGVNTDASVRRLKGFSRPVHSQDDRALVLAALAVVDLVVLFDEDTPRKLIEYIEPDVLVKGSDYGIDGIVGANSVLERGGQVLRFDLIPGRSTTNTIEKMKTEA